MDKFGTAPTLATASTSVDEQHQNPGRRSHFWCPEEDLEPFLCLKMELQFGAPPSGSVMKKEP